MNHFRNEPVFPDFFSGALELNKITLDMISRIANENLSAQQDFIQSQTAHFDKLSRVSDLQEVLSLNAQHLQSMGPSLFQHAQNNLDAILSGFDQYAKWVQKGYQQPHGAQMKRDTRAA